MKRTVIGVVAAFTIGVFAVALPVVGGSASAGGGGSKGVVGSLGTKYTMFAESDVKPDTRISGIRCEDQDCLRTVSKVAVPDGGTVVMGGIKCEDQDCF